MSEVATSDITSGEIASAVKETTTAAASPAQHTPDATDASPRVTPGTDADKYKGWIPPDAHERIVDGFHRRLDDTAWASGLSRAEVEEALALRRSTAARTAPQEPQPDAIDDARQPYYTPKQAAAWAAWKAEQIVEARMADIEARIGPIESTFESSRQHDTLARQVDTAQQWPGFLDHVADITAAITKNNEDRARNPRVPLLSLHEAYISIVPSKLAASREAIEAEGKKKWLAELNDTTAVTRHEVNPGRTAAASRKADKDMSLGELIADEHARRKAG